MPRQVRARSVRTPPDDKEPTRLRAWALSHPTISCVLLPDTDLAKLRDRLPRERQHRITRAADAHQHVADPQASARECDRATRIPCRHDVTAMRAVHRRGVSCFPRGFHISLLRESQHSHRGDVVAPRVLACTAVYCRVLPCTAVYCRVLPCTAVYCFD